VRLWDLTEAKVLSVLVEGREVNLQRSRASAFSRNGTRVAIDDAAAFGNTVRIHNAESGQVIASLRGHSRPVSSMKFSADGSRVMTQAYFRNFGESEVMIWEAQDGTQKGAFLLRSEVLALSADGTRILAFAPKGQDAKESILDAADGRPLAELQGRWGRAAEAAFSPDGTLVATVGSGDYTALWDARTGKLFAALNAHTAHVDHVVFSPDGSYVVTGSHDRTAKIWTTKDGKVQATLPHEATVMGLAFSPDGQRLATKADDMVVRVWDVESGALVTSTSDDSRWVDAMAFSPSGALLATKWNDAVSLWDARSGEKVATLSSIEPKSSVAFSSNGRHLVTAEYTGAVRVWAATPDGFLIQACQYLRPWPAYAEVADTCAPWVDKTP
jgi:WD40 repeat protein